MNLNSYFEFKILCPVADKENSTGKTRGYSCVCGEVMGKLQIGTKDQVMETEENGGEREGVINRARKNVTLFSVST